MGKYQLGQEHFSEILDLIQNVMGFRQKTKLNIYALIGPFVTLSDNLWGIKKQLPIYFKDR